LSVGCTKEGEQGKKKPGVKKTRRPGSQLGGSAGFDAYLRQPGVMPGGRKNLRIELEPIRQVEDGPDQKKPIRGVGKVGARQGLTPNTDLLPAVRCRSGGECFRKDRPFEVGFPKVTKREATYNCNGFVLDTA